MKIKKGNLNFDQTGRAYPDNPHIEENWDCIWENEGKHYKLVGDINNKEWSEVTQLDILTSHMVYEEYLGREEDPRNEVFGYKTSIVGQMLDSDNGFGQVGQSIDEDALESEHFHKADTIDGQWLSLVKSEREWQEEKLAEIFHHYPNASPRWQYMNGLIHMALEYIEMTKEKE